MALLPDLVGRIRLDMSELNRAQSEATSRGAAIGSALGTAIGSLAGGLLAEAGQKVMTFVSGSIEAFSRLEDATSVAGIRFGEAGGAVTKFSEGAAKSLGMSKASALEAANTFSVFGKQVGLTGAPLADFSTGMTQLAGDMASFVGTSPEEAIQAIGSAFRGEFDPIEKYGVVLSAAAVQNKALEMGMVPVNGQLTQQQKILATQKLIWEQTSDAQGDFARTGDSVANTQHRIAAETENAQAALGQKLAPAYLAVLNALNPLITGLTTFLGFMTDVVRFCWEWRDAIVALGAVILIMNARMIAFNAQMVAFLIVNAVRTAVQGFTAAFWALNAAMIANPIGAVIAVLAALVAGVIVAYNHSETFRRIVDGLFAKLKEFIDWCGPAVEAWAVKVSTSFGQAVTDLDNFGNGVNNWLTKMGTSLAQAYTDVEGFGTNVNNSLTQTGTDLDAFGDHVNALPGKVAAGLATFAQVLWDSIVAGWNRARDAAKLAIDTVVTDSGALVARIMEALASFGQMLLDKIVGAWNAIPPGIRQPIEAVVGAARQMATDIINSLINLPTQMVQMGKDVINGLLNGLQQLGPQVVSYLTNLIPEPVRNALNIHSPSGIMDEIGQDTMAGLNQGLERWLPTIRDTLGQIITIINEVKAQLKISSPSGVMEDMGDMTGQGFHVGLEAWIPKIQALLDRITAMVSQANQQMSVLAEDGSKVSSSFYDAVDVGHMKQADIDALLAKGYKGDPTDKREILYAPGKNSRNTPINPTAAQLASARAPANMSKMIRAEDGTLVPASFYSGIKNAPNTLGTMANLPGHSLYPADLFDKIKNAAYKLGEMVMAEDGSLVPASFYANVKPAPKASKLVQAEDGTLVPESFYSKMAFPTGANLAKFVKAGLPADLAKLVSYSAKGIGVDVGNAPKGLADALYALGFRGDPTDKAERLYSSADLPTLLGRAGLNIDARSYGTQLNAKDVVDQILWKAKAGGLVPA